MSAKFATMIQILTFSGEITVLENKKVPYKMDRKPVIPWPLLRRDKMKYYENKEKDIQAIKVADSVYLVNIVYIKDTPFIFASKRDMRSIRGKNFVEVKLEVTNFSCFIYYT